MSADAEVVVVGAGVAGLVIAHDLARAGVRVVVCEASARVGGLLTRATLAGVDLDVGAESFATRTDAVARLVADAGLDLELVEPRPGGAHLVVAAADGIRRAPLPRRTVLGIPADPTAPDVVAVVGAAAAARAATEPSVPLTDGAEPTLFDLVAQRCGPAVAERLVDTLCRSVYSQPAAHLRLSQVHPAMWRAYRELGSLTAAAAALAPLARAGASVGGIAGGMWRLPDALARAAARHGARIRTATTVTRIDGGAAGDLVVRTATGSITTRRVVVATGPGAASDLIVGGVTAGAGALSRTGAAGRVRVVAAAIDNAGLDPHPVGSGVIVDPAVPTAAKALTHVTAKWGWAEVATGPGRHLVRLSARDAADGVLSTPEEVAREVSLLTGVAVGPADVVDLVVQDWHDAVTGAPAATRPDATPASADTLAGIHRAGAAVAGTGLASVIPHARALAAEVATALATVPDRTRSPA